MEAVNRVYEDCKMYPVEIVASIVVAFLLCFSFGDFDHSMQASAPPPRPVDATPPVWLWPLISKQQAQDGYDGQKGQKGWPGYRGDTGSVGSPGSQKGHIGIPGAPGENGLRVRMCY